MIDYSNILETLIRTAREPHYSPALSSTNGVPNVYQARPENPKTEYPSIIVDILDTQEQHSWITNRYVDEDNNTTYSTNYHIVVNFRVYGTDKNGSASSILNQLQGYLRFNRVLDEITQLTGGEVVRVDEIESLPILQANKYRESASFNLIFGITDTSVDNMTKTITDVDLDGELFHYEGDENPLDITINVP